jgi:hypothetical protein
VETVQEPPEAVSGTKDPQPDDKNWAWALQNQAYPGGRGSLRGREESCTARDASGPVEHPAVWPTSRALYDAFQALYDVSNMAPLGTLQRGEGKEIENYKILKKNKIIRPYPPHPVNKKCANMK